MFRFYTIVVLLIGLYLLSGSACFAQSGDSAERKAILKKLKPQGKKNAEGYKTGRWTEYEEEMYDYVSTELPDLNLDTFVVRMQGEYVHGVRDGIWKIYALKNIKNYKKSSAWVIKQEVTFRMGVRQGEEKLHYLNGYLMLLHYFNNDREDSDLKAWYPDGSLMMLASRVDGVPAGEQEIFYPGGATLRKESHFNNGVQEGPYKEYYADGQLKIETKFSGGQMEGPYKQYYPDGKEEFEYIAEKGVWNGPFKKFYEDGQLQAEGEMEFGQLSGPYKEYYPDGKLHREGRYVRNQEEGLWNEYSEEGKLLSACNYIEGRRNGKSTYYHLSGKDWRQEIWVEDALMNISYVYDRDGHTLTPGTLKDGNGSVIEYDEQDHRLREVQYSHGQPQK
jgi:antitoxin component YwqK of YwqJK toxin-antitoxin module